MPQESRSGFKSGEAGDLTKLLYCGTRHSSLKISITPHYIQRVASIRNTC